MTQQQRKLDDLRIHGRDKSGQGAGTGFKLGILVALVFGLGIAGYLWFRQPKALEVHTVTARQASGASEDRTVLNASGYVTARRSATVSSKVTGKVVEVFVEEGKRVELGEILARLDDTNVKASLHLAEARLASATNALEETQVRIREADKELRRQEDLIKNKIATEADYDHAEAGALALKARLQQQLADVVVAERELATWQQQLDDTVIRAPFSGIVTSKNAQPGEMISPISAGGGFTRTGICTIVDMDSLEIEIDVNESYINRVEPSQAVVASLDAYPEWNIPCKVIAIIPTADRQKSTVKVRVGFDKLDKRMLPDMGVKVAFREGAGAASTPVAKNGVIIPKGAVQKQDGRDVVYVVRDDRAERRAVSLGNSSGEDVFVMSGLVAGDRVLTMWPTGLTDGMVVREIKR
jgi:HlyD family secretion protein